MVYLFFAPPDQYLRLVVTTHKECPVHTNNSVLVHFIIELRVWATDVTQKKGLLALFLMNALPTLALYGGDPIHLGSQRELFSDRFLIDSLSGDVEQKVKRPHPEEVIFHTDRPWEGNTSAYYTLFQDGSVFRMYYRGSHFDTNKQKPAHREATCYAESKDGIHWVRPNLGMYSFEGSRNNNIVWDGTGTHCFAPFRDTNPRCPKNARYKAISRGRPQAPRGLYQYLSPDGIRWTHISDKPIITQGAFDSQNIAFWDSRQEEYVCYSRSFKDGFRTIQRATSKDFIQWTAPVALKYGSAPRQHLYTNAIRQYDRAPHLYIGFPTRYLPEEKNRVEPLFMISRDGLNFLRFNTPVIPEDAPADRGGNRSNYMTRGLLTLPDKPDEYSVYATEAYYTGSDSRVRRFSYRVDGFVSLTSGSQGGEFVTPALTFDGGQLLLNHITSKNGDLRVEIQDPKGNAIQGWTLMDCDNTQGNHIEQPVTWRNGKTLRRLNTQTIRLRFVMQNAELFAMRFQ